MSSWRYYSMKLSASFVPCQSIDFTIDNNIPRLAKLKNFVCKSEAGSSHEVYVSRIIINYGEIKQTTQEKWIQKRQYFIGEGHWRNYSNNYRDKASDVTTGKQLQRVLHYSVTPCRPLQSCIRRNDTNAIYDVDCDEVYPRIYIGDAAAAKNKQYLRLMGITHVLNTAEGSRFGQVDTGHSYYRDMSNLSKVFRYMGFPLTDHPSTDISRYFYIASKFIENGINSGGKVLVHCMVGMSRSATCALAYLMIARKMSAAEAIRTVRMHRDIHPNEGFIQQLADLDNELKRER